MNLGPRLRVGAVGAGVVLLLAGCTSGSADAPPTSPVASPTVSPSVIDPSSLVLSSSPVSSSSPSTVESSAAPSPQSATQDESDRAAIEAQWRNFWSVYTGIIRTPADQRAVRLDAVSVEPAKSKILEAASRLESEGLDYYGDVILKPYAIDIDSERGLAVIQDCQDQSGYGSVFVQSGEKRTVGVADNNTQAGFIRGIDGIWRVQNIQYPSNATC